MSRNLDAKREHVRQLSLVAYVVMLALIVPLTILALQKEQEVRTRAAELPIVTPSFYPLTTCPSCVTVSITPAVSSGPAPTTQTNPSTGITQTPVDPCATGAAIAHNHKKSKHRAHRGDVSNFIQQLLEWLIELINKLFGDGTINLPDTVPQPSTVPNQEENPNEQNPCPEPSIIPITSAPQPTVSTVLPSINVPSAVPSQPAGGSETTVNVQITFYGAYDNDPKGSKAISNPVKHQEAGGTGTYVDPLTFASPQGTGEYKVGQIIYVPLVQKYFIREDVCATSWTAPNGCGAVSHVDLYVGNPSDAEAVVACEDSLTPSGNAQIIIDPASNLTVDPNPIWNQATGKCMTPHN